MLMDDQKKTVFFVDQKAGNLQEKLVAEKLRQAGIFKLVREKKIGKCKNRCHYKLYRLDEEYL